MQRHLDRTSETNAVTETDADTVTAPERPKLQISATTITAGAVASVAAALLGSTLGVAGTVAGAALGAVVSSLASALYQHSVAATRYRMQTLRSATGGHGWLAVRREPGAGQRSAASRARWDDDTAPDSETTQEIPMEALLDAVIDREPEAGLAADAQPLTPRRPRNPRRPHRPGGWLDNWRGVLAGSLGAAFAFALALIVVTGIESAKGAPLSGGTAGGLSVLGGGSYQNVGAGSAPETSPVTVTVQPSAPVTSEPIGSPQTTTETVISTQTQTETATETETETATQTETAPSTDTAEPTASSSATAPPESGQSQPTTTPGTTPVTTTPPGPDAASALDANSDPSGEFAPSGRRS